MSEAVPPHWAALAWRLRGAATAGEGLSVGRIVQAGIEVADNRGLAGLSLRRLGEHLGAGTMAAYRYIESKDELILLMIDSALGAPPAEIAEAPTWQASIRLWAAGMAARYRSHPWLFDAPLVGMSATPNRLLWFECLLQPLAQTGLELQSLLDAALLVDGHVRNVAYLGRELDRMMALPSQEPMSWLSALLDESTFPMTRQVFATGLLADGTDSADGTGGTGSTEGTERDMEFGLARIIAGIEDLSGANAT